MKTLFQSIPILIVLTGILAGSFFALFFKTNAKNFNGDKILTMLVTEDENSNNSKSKILGNPYVIAGSYSSIPENRKITSKIGSSIVQTNAYDMWVDDSFFELMDLNIIYLKDKNEILSRKNQEVFVNEALWNSLESKNQTESVIYLGHEKLEIDGIIQNFEYHNYLKEGEPVLIRKTNKPLDVLNFRVREEGFAATYSYLQNKFQHKNLKKINQKIKESQILEMKLKENKQEDVAFFKNLNQKKAKVHQAKNIDNA